MRLALEGAFEAAVPPMAASMAVPQPAVWRRPVPLALAASLVTAVVVSLAVWSLTPSFLRMAWLEGLSFPESLRRAALRSR